MKKRLSIILCIAMMVCLIPSTAFAKTVKAKSVSIAPKSMTLAVDDIAQLSATMKPNNATSKLTWYSSDETIATVSNKGLVQGKAKGTATITVETSNGKTAECVIKVKEYAEKGAEATTTTTTTTTGDVFTAIKDKIIDLIKSLTYTKSEIDRKIDEITSGGGSSSEEPTDISEIMLYPNIECTKKDTLVVLENKKPWETTKREVEEYTDVVLEPLTIHHSNEWGYYEYLDFSRKGAIDEQGYAKYGLGLVCRGSVDTKYAGYKVIYGFSTDKQEFMEDYTVEVDELDEIDCNCNDLCYSTVNNDGTFTCVINYRTNKLPKEIYLAYLMLENNN